MTEPLVSPVFLFRFSVPCRYCAALWGTGGVELDETYRLPSFGRLEGRPVFADLRAAWSPEGLSFTLAVTGKKQSPWCRPTRPEDSDGLHLWIDTRDTHNIHRATRFCHRFVFLPLGGRPRGTGPVAMLVPINRARHQPRPVAASALQVRSQRQPDGYRLQAHIPAAALTGYDPSEHKRLGFSYAVVDHELGWQTFSVGPELPFAEDPSLWGTLQLVQQ